MMFTTSKGTIVTSFLFGEVKLDLARFAPTDAHAGTTSDAAPAPATKVSIMIDSSVPGA